MTNFIYISDSATLDKYCRQLHKVKQFALDTEFIRKDTYYPRLSLIQISAQGLQAIVDVLSIADLSPLSVLMDARHIEKIMHDPEQDIEALSLCGCSAPAPIYDTQLAAAFLGHERKISYKNLLDTLLNIKIDKSCTLSDWLQRPLTDSQIQYALEDVHYLEDLRSNLDTRLQNSGKQIWFEEESGQKQYIHQPYWERLPKKNIVTNHTAMVRLQRMVEWRENVAQRENRPRQWIISNACLYHLAAQTRVEHGLKSMICKKATQHAEQLKALWQKPLPMKEEILNNIPPPLDHNERQQLRSLQAMVNDVAQAYALAPTLLSSKKQMTKLIRYRHKPLFDGWRNDLMGARAEQIIAE